MKKLHAQHQLPYESTVAWTRCGLHGDKSMIAAFEEGVTCKKCRAALDWDKEAAAESAARRARQEVRS